QTQRPRLSLTLSPLPTSDSLSLVLFLPPSTRPNPLDLLLHRDSLPPSSLPSPASPGSQVLMLGESMRGICVSCDAPGQIQSRCICITWQRNMCKLYILFNLGFSEPSIFLILVFLLCASLLKGELGALNQGWSKKAIGHVFLFCLPIS
ncbi:unnamed protein product, partial [Musa banksii]